MKRVGGIAAALLLGLAPAAYGSPPNVADPGLPATTSAARAIASTGSDTFLAGVYGIGPQTGAALGFDATSSAAVSLPVLAGGGVAAAVPDGAGGWYVGGGFDRVAGAVRNALVHVRSDGTIDQSFPQTDSEGFVASLALSADGSTLYVGGSFTQLGGQARPGLAAISTASGAVTAWAPALTGTFPSVNRIAVGAGTTDGYVFVGGDFTGVGAIPAGDLAKINTTSGAADGSFLPDPTASGGADVYALAVSTSGSSLYVGGYFDHIGGQARNDLGRVATTGGSDGQAESWDPEPDSEVEDIAVQPGGGTVFVAGEFANVGGQARNAVAAISSSSGLATSWNAQLSPSQVTSIAFTASGLLIVGDFESVGSTSRPSGVAIVDPANATPTAFDPVLLGDPQVGASSGNDIVIGGYWMTSPGSVRQGLAELDPYGHLTSFAPTISGQIESGIYAMTLSPDHKTLYVGGSFTAVDGQPRASLAAFDTATGSLTSWQSGIKMGGDFVNALAVSPDGQTLYVGGDFGELGSDSQPRADVGAVSTTDGKATAWNPGAGGGGFPEVSALALSPDGGTVYVGGVFTTAGGQPRSNLAAISAAGSGAATAWAPNPHSGVGVEVSALAVGADGTVYAGGVFTTAGSNAVARVNLAAISPSGTGAATAWNPGVVVTNLGRTPSVDTLGLSEDGTTLFVGGAFDQLAGQPRNGLGEVSVTSGAATAWNPDPGGARIDAVSVGTGAVRVGGDFQRMGNDALQGYAQFTSAPTVTAVPKLTGTPRKGKTLSCQPGSFANSPQSTAFAWLRDGDAISGPIGTTYTVLGSDSGHALACSETASNAGGSATATSASLTPGPHIDSFKVTTKHRKRYFTFSITEKAKVTIVVRRLQRGVKRHGKCRAGMHGRRCTRKVKLGSVSGSARAGSNKLRIRGKVGRHRLSAGRYQATIGARDTGQPASNLRAATFTIR